MKVKTLLSLCVLLLFSILAGGSFAGDDIKSLLWFAGGTFVCIVVGGIIHSAVQSNDKKKRLEMIEKDEIEDKDFDRSVSFGNDRCKFYFDASKKQVMIMRVIAEGTNKQFVDGFEFGGKELCHQHDPYFCIYDSKNRKLLTGTYEGITPIFSVRDVATEDKHKDIIPKSDIAPRIVSNIITTANNLSPTKEFIYTLVDETHGLMSIVRKGKVSSIFNYINRASLSRKTGNKSYVSDKGIGNYHFIMDDFFNVIVIVTPSSYELFNYSDIIEVSYEENGTQLYSKSAMHTIGGAIVGGALMGSAGAVVGGLSGSSKKIMEINTMQIKILLRNTQRRSFVLDFNDSKRVLKTSKSADNTMYENYQKNAKRANDTLSVIIDRAKQSAISTVLQVAQTPSSTKSGIADEIAKLAKLKADGILTDEEFNAQKKKLLNL